ncbi:tetratricopeptide repeat protein [Peribacillus frigoritolerans]|uniref:tetratricopeptide repeat protein n=1 Tax=Peribacillus frigoritolerans TaxID=450367 RepID=UPI001F4F38B5|nr:tetratricopeptide repeat protein [Peribacillus frigoritolerans]MCK2017947.1 tetratricopeptide repeat protein [Peribacillus frigoritolerans]
MENKSLINKLSLTYSNLALVLERIGNLKEAKESILQSIHIVKEYLNGNEVLLAKYYNNLGFIYLKVFEYKKNIRSSTNNELDLAKKYINRSLRLFRKIIGENHLHYCSILNNLGMVYEKEGNFNEAKKKYMQGINNIKVIGQVNHKILSQLESNLGSASWMSGDFKEGEELLLSALERDISIYGQIHLEVAMDLEKLALMYFESKQFEKSANYYLNAYNIFKKTVGRFTPTTVLCLENLFYIKRLQDDSKEIKRIFPILLEASKKLYGENHVNVTNLKKLSKTYVL